MFNYVNRVINRQSDFNQATTIYDPRVAVVAIAKDEAAYIHEWIHHYLYFGFTNIFIGINRLTDSTLDILSKINLLFPNVSFFDVSWIDKGCLQDKNPQMQSLSYAFISNHIRINHRDITHVLYCDVDEFLFNYSFNFNINRYIKKMSDFDALSFAWLNQNGDNSEFLKPFNNLNVSYNRHMKTIHAVSSFSRITEFRCHCSKYNDDFIHITSNGSPVRYGEHDQVFKTNDVNQSFFLLHRMVRSKLEYTAMLMRERPGVQVPIKNNRSGFSTSFDFSIDINNNALNNYWQSLDEFVIRCDLAFELENARSKIKIKSESVLSISPKVLIAHLDSYLNVLKGTEYHDKIISILENSDNSIFTDNYAAKLNDIAVRFESNKDFTQAFRYISLARKCRPHGPVIIDNFNRLKALSNNVGTI